MSVIGIDLGTTNSCVAVIKGRGVEVIANAEGDRVTPSVVFFPESSEPIVGAHARRRLGDSPERVAVATKRLMGRLASDKGVQDLAVGYDIVAGPVGEAMLSIGGRTIAPEKVAAYILADLRQAAEDATSEKVTGAVITVPAYFNDAQRRATTRAAELAGLPLLALLKEPTAAAMAYGMDRRDKKKIAVFDLGGGTFDISVMEIGQDVHQVLGVCGDAALGGEDFDKRIADILFKRFKDMYKSDLARTPSNVARFMVEARRAKHELSRSNHSEINIPFIDKDPQSGVERHLNVKLSRADIETATIDLIKKTLGPCNQAFKDAAMKPHNIQDVLLVGGMTRMPKVQEVVNGFFAKIPCKGVNPDEAVAVGAALHAAVKAGLRVAPQLFDINSIPIGVGLKDGSIDVLIPRKEPLPVRRIGRYTTSRDEQDNVKITIYQGETGRTVTDQKLGEFEMEGIAPAPAGQPDIEVAFDLGTDGLLEVLATDIATGKAIPVQNFRVL